MGMFHLWRDGCFGRRQFITALLACVLLKLSGGVAQAYNGESVVIGDDTFFVVHTKYSNELGRVNKDTPGKIDVFELTPHAADPYRVNRISSDPGELVVFRGELYFSAKTEHFGRELWKYEASANTVRMVKDIHLGSWGSAPTDLIVFNGALYFLAYTTDGGRELWRSDGSEEGTVMVTDILPGKGNPRLTSLIRVNDKLMFFGITESHELTLWVSDGTSTGTRMILEMNGMQAFSPPQVLENTGSQFRYMTWGRNGDAALWETDGTAEGTVKLSAMDAEAIAQLVASKAINLESRQKISVPEGASLRNVYSFGEKDMSYKIDWEKLKSKVSRPRNSSVKDGDVAWINDTVFFAGESEQYGIELWKSDGTLDGTVMVKDIHPGRNYQGANDSMPVDFLYHEGVVYFIADQAVGIYDVRLWRTDGTDAGTYPVLTEKRGYLKWLICYHDRLYFLQRPSNPERFSLWKSDGTPEGTFRIGE